MNEQDRSIMGFREATLMDMTLKQWGEKAFVELRLEIFGDEGPVEKTKKVFITEKSANIAKAQLKKCGFNWREQSLEQLLPNNPEKLDFSGNKFEVECSTREFMGNDGPVTILDVNIVLEKMSQKDAKSLDDLFHKKSESQPAAKTNDEFDPDNVDDPIPF